MTNKIYPKVTSTTSSTSATSSTVFTSTSSNAAHSAHTVVGTTAQRQLPNSKKLEHAVYSHIKAVRALGRTSINTAEIARALNIPESEIAAIIGNLKGVRVSG